MSALADLLGQSDPAVSQMSRKLLDYSVVREWPENADCRRRLLVRSRIGVPSWADSRLSGRQLLRRSTNLNVCTRSPRL